MMQSLGGVDSSASPLTGDMEPEAAPAVGPALPEEPAPSQPSRRSRSARSGSSRVGSRRAWSSGGHPCSRGAPPPVTRHESHVPLFPYLGVERAMLLEPFPNRRILSVAMVGDTLVTTHRNGVRLYREREGRRGEGRASPSAAHVVPDRAPRMWIWDLLETRYDVHLRDAYLSCAIEPLWRGERVLPSPYGRYVGVAAGSDATGHGVCVLSTGAHFNVHHEKHGRNKVVCMHFTHLVMDASPERTPSPFLVSIDEVGGIVLFDVERRAAVVLQVSAALQQRPRPARLPSETPSPTAPGGGGWRLSQEVQESGLTALLEDPGQSQEAYQLDNGLATRVALVGPCLGLCNRCHNVFSGGTPPGPSPYVAMSLLTCSRARDVAPSETVPGAPSEQAELNVRLLRLLWSPSRAVLWEEVDLARETAAVPVCDSGVALLAQPHDVGLPREMLVARPRLRFWSVSACTGQLLQLRRVYAESDGSGRGTRSPREYFVKLEPLGRFTLLQDRATSWFCTVAVTDEGAVLLLGQAPRGREPRSIALEDVPTSTRDAAEERRRLEAWLEEVQREEDGGAGAEPAPCEAPPPLPPPASPLSPFVEHGQDYKVLLELHAAAAAARRAPSPGRHPVEGPTTVREAVEPVPDRVLDLWASADRTALILFLAGEEALLSVPLPFVPDEPSRGMAAAPPPPAHPARRTTPAESTEAPREWAAFPWSGDGSAWTSGVSALVKWGVAPANGGPRRNPSPAEPVAYGFNLVRPIVTSLARLSRGEEAEHTPREAPPDAAASAALMSSLSTSARVADAAEEPSDASARRTEASAADPTPPLPTPAPRGGAVVIRLSGGASRPRRRREPIAPLDDAERAVYARRAVEHMTLTGERGDGARSEGGGGGDVAPRLWAASVVQLAQVEEPLGRNAIDYAWRDAHNEMYMDHFTAVGAFARARTEAQPLATRDWEADRAVYHCYTIADSLRSTAAPGFLQSFNALRERRRVYRDRRGVFDFETFFATRVVPQSIVDQHERDRCTYELADMRLQHTAALARIDPSQEVVIYQNEEKVPNDATPGRHRWRAHQTFPFDNEEGRVVDMWRWNTGATDVDGEAGQWRWDAEEVGPPPPARRIIAMTSKELRHWVVSAWEYAPRWPSPHDRDAMGFEWSAEERADSAVRRRRLTRRRLHLGRLAQQAKLLADQAVELEELRVELGL